MRFTMKSFSKKVIILATVLSVFFMVSCQQEEVLPSSDVELYIQENQSTDGDHTEGHNEGSTSEGD